MRSGRGRSRWLGSSPLTRGKLELDAHARRIPRLIPAHAGKTQTPQTINCGGTAHPRSRGENAYQFPSRLIWSGSSPLTRGKLDRPESPAPGPRLIPAHAGKTSAPVPLVPVLQAHPRSRGENSPVSSSIGSVAGSSPLTRGKLDPPPLQPSEERLIPAHAGKTRSTAVHPIGRRAHPRSRGENGFARLTAVGLSGSSPLTRGKRVHRREGRRTRRLIPAHAGKTAAASSDDSPIEAHPRSRGENRELKQDDTGACGSSPLTRGKLAGATVSAPIPRLIPAHAGKTSRGHERLPS